MSDSRKDAKSIFIKAIESCEPHEWDVYLKFACGDDAELRQQVEALLEAHRQEDSLFDRAAATDDSSPGVSERAGTEIGDYKLLQQIGEGGFGVVYMAEQLRPVKRKVALKIIKPGMDTKEVVARFEAERQALALMNHPNIAKVFDGGATESGRPYFVMELVKGVPITRFCDDNSLSLQDRLDLFADVCAAIQHAHQKGVVHRDVKPSNVMVTLHDGKPVTKVIDFGVAKAISQQLTEKTMFTAYGQMIGTPQYMSPEQAEMSGLDIDTRTDIYSLGVLLFELLTGTTPLSARQLRETAYVELQRLIRDSEPPKPSTRVSTMGDDSAAIAKQRGIDPRKLGLLLRGDLDWIVMKALEKDRNRRYDSAGHLAEDIANYLQDKAISARPPSTIYQMRKLLRRNRARLFKIVGSTSAVVLVLLFTMSILKALHMARDVEAERQRALEAARRARAASEAVE